MSNTKTVKDVYLQVVVDVISGVREAFFDEGMDEQVLLELRQLWESKLAMSKALETTETKPPQHHAPPQQQQRQPLPHQARTAPVQQQSMSVVGAQNATTLQQLNPMLVNIGAPMTASGHLAANALPSGLFQQLQQQRIQQQQPYESFALSGQGQRLLLPAGAGPFSLVPPSQTTDPSQIKRLPQTDGLDDSSSDDDNADDDDEDDDEEANDDDDAADEEDPLNSGDDVSDADPAEVFDAENVIVCQFDKINRSKNKWKFHLKDGIMNLHGKDQLFMKASGDAEW